MIEKGLGEDKIDKIDKKEDGYSFLFRRVF